MAERIMMTPQELNDAAAYVRERLEAINGERDSLKAKIDDVASRWEGAAQQSFMAQFNDGMYPILRDNVPQVLEGVAGELDAAANTIRDADSSLASAFKG